MAARQAAQQAMAGITFTNRLSDMQVVARHAYALTFEREYVEQWEQQRGGGMWDGRTTETHELEEDGEDASAELRSRSVAFQGAPSKLTCCQANDQLRLGVLAGARPDRLDDLGKEEVSCF